IARREYFQGFVFPREFCVTRRATPARVALLVCRLEQNFGLPTKAKVMSQMVGGGCPRTAMTGALQEDLRQFGDYPTHPAGEGNLDHVVVHAPARSEPGLADGTGAVCPDAQYFAHPTRRVGRGRSEGILNQHSGVHPRLQVEPADAEPISPPTPMRMH